MTAHCDVPAGLPWWRRAWRALRQHFTTIGAGWALADLTHDLANARGHRAYYAERHMYWEREVLRLVRQHEAARDRLDDLLEEEERRE